MDRLDGAGYLCCSCGLPGHIDVDYDHSEVSVRFHAASQEVS